MQNVTSVVEFVRLSGAAAAAQTAVTNTVDTDGYESVACVVQLGDVTDTSVLTLKAQTGDASNGSDAADVSGATTTFTAGASNADQKQLILDVVRPTKRYVTFVLTRGTANAAVEGVYALRYRPRKAPVTQAQAVAHKIAQG